jgi:hypothetical protein
MTDDWHKQLDAIVAEVAARYPALAEKPETDAEIDAYLTVSAAYEAECWQRMAALDPDNEFTQMAAAAHASTPTGTGE